MVTQRHTAEVLVLSCLACGQRQRYVHRDALARHQTEMAQARADAAEYDSRLRERARRRREAAS